MKRWSNLQEDIGFSLCLINENIIRINSHNYYTGSKESAFIPQIAAESIEGISLLNGSSLPVGMLKLDSARDCLRIYRRRGQDWVELCAFISVGADGAKLKVNSGCIPFGIGADNESQTLDRSGQTYVVHHRETGQGANYMPWILFSDGFGVFIDSSFPMTIGLQDEITVRGSHIRAFYFIEGPSVKEALARFVGLTGIPPMHPAWSLGYEQVSRTWMCPGEVDFVTRYFREKHIPCDGFTLLSTYDGNGALGRRVTGEIHAGYLDGYQGWNVRGSYRRYNPSLFPNEGKDIATLKERGFHPIVHGYWETDFSDEESNERVWRDHQFLLEDGFDGWWLDGCEAIGQFEDRFGWSGEEISEQHAVFPYVPRDYLPEDTTRLQSKDFHDEYDNIWALLRAKAFYEKQRRDFPERRVYILNRTAFPGLQRYAAGVNQGDYWSSWQLLRSQIVWLLSMGLSGITFPESDIGGHFLTDELTDELFIRWAFLGAFAPIMRSHGHNWRCRLPWGFGPENERRFTGLIRLRYSFFPYNYTLLSQCQRTGLPLARAMFLEFPEDEVCRSISDQFMWGSNILVAPVVHKGATQRKVYLPAGQWTHFWTMGTFSGPAWIEIDAPLAKDPFFIKGGTILPLMEPTDTIPETSYHQLTLLVIPAQQPADPDGGMISCGSFTLYDDDRRTYKYENGEWSNQRFSVFKSGKTGHFLVSIGPVEGEHGGVIHSREYRLEIPETAVPAQTIKVDEKEIPKIDLAEWDKKVKPYWLVDSGRIIVELDRKDGSRVIELFP